MYHQNLWFDLGATGSLGHQDLFLGIQYFLDFSLQVSLGMLKVAKHAAENSSETEKQAFRLDET